MIRHFLQAIPSEIGLLPFPMIPTTLQPVLVIAVVFAAFPSPPLFAAPRSAIDLTSLAATADEEHIPAERAKRLPEQGFLKGGHVPIGRDWTKAAELCEAVSVLESEMPLRRPSRKTPIAHYGRGFLFPLEP